MNKIDSNRIYSGATPRQVATDLAPLVDFQEEGLSKDILTNLLETRLLPHLTRYDDPGFHALYNMFLEEGAELGAQIALAYNQGVTGWQVSPGGAVLEELCCQALCRLFGLAPEGDATFMYSGTYANQQALYMALHWKAEQAGFNFSERGLSGFENPSRLIAVTSVEAHFSLRHAIRMMGLGDKNLKTVAVDQNRRIDLPRLRESLLALQEHHDIFCITLTAGTSSTGAIDPIAPVIELCRELGLESWIHLDAAYGLVYSLLPERAHRFSGIDQADSITWDPHKQFGVPIPNSLLFVRRSQDFERMAIFGGYFNRKGETVPNPGLKSPPSTRPFSALPVVTSIRYQGLEKLRQRLRAPLSAVEATVEYIKTAPDIELVHQPDLGLFCIRIRPAGFPNDQMNQLQKYIYDRVVAEGQRSISMTSIDDITVLRFLVISPTVTAKSLLETITYLRRLADGYSKLT